MNAPGVSEDKAIAIVKQYPTMKSLMEEFEKTGNKKALEDVKVVHKYDESKPKRLGPAASIKISKLLTSDNPSDIV